jgi:hypothetical protein
MALLLIAVRKGCGLSINFGLSKITKEYWPSIILFPESVGVLALIRNLIGVLYNQFYLRMELTSAQIIIFVMIKEN